MSKPTSIKIRLYPGQDDDLIKIKAEIDRLPHGERGRALKNMIRRGAKEPEPAAGVDLGELRRVVESAIRQELGRVSLTQAPEPERERESAQAASILADLGADLILS